MSLKDELQSQIYNAQRKLALLEQFPDLHKYSGRWDKYLCSELVNPIATGVDFVHSCGCCSDAVLYAMPYVEVAKERIYSDPAQIAIGEKSPNGGERSWHNWAEKIKDHGLPGAIIEQIKKMFEENQERDEEDDL
jgi:hypothetical protein